MARKLLLGLLMIVAAGGVLWHSGRAASESAPAYSNDFQGSVGCEWSNRSTDVTPSGRRFLGQFNNGEVSLTLAGLGTHSEATVTFDLYVIRTWDGNDPGSGPDIFDLSVVGGLTLLHTTFSNNDGSGQHQAYPDMYPGGDHPLRTGATENNTLGYFFRGVPVDSVYHLSFTFAHATPTLQLTFSASNLEPPDNESWGIDNVQVFAGDQQAVAPCSTMTAPKSEFTTHPRFLVSWTGPAGSAFDLRYRLAPFDGDFGPYSFLVRQKPVTSTYFRGLPGYSYCFSARLHDPGGATSDWSSESCTALPVDDVLLTAQGAWSRNTNGGYYLDTYSASSTRGATLSLPNIHARRLALYATVCPECGSLLFDWNGILLRKVNLASSVTETEHKVTFPAFPTIETGTATIWVQSSGARVEIDALGVIQK